MKEVKKILDLIGIENFNNLTIMFLNGDSDVLEEWLFELTMEPDESFAPDWVEKIYKELGYNDETFPWAEFEEYVEQVKSYLKLNMIVRVI